MCVGRWLVSALVWSCPAQCSLSCLDSNWSRTLSSGACMSRGQELGRLSASAQLLQDPPCICIFTNRLPSCQARDGSRMRPLLLSVFMWVLFCDLRGQPHIYVHLVDMCVLCACWEHILSLTTGWIWGHGAAAASPLLGCCIQMMYFPLMHSS